MEPHNCQKEEEVILGNSSLHWSLCDSVHLISHLPFALSKTESSQYREREEGFNLAISTGILHFDLTLIATKMISSFSYTEKCAL